MTTVQEQAISIFNRYHKYSHYTCERLTFKQSKEYSIMAIWFLMDFLDCGSIPYINVKSEIEFYQEVVKEIESYTPKKYKQILLLDKYL
jgi:ABC-type uncharacterized transport system permease subunit